MQILRNEAYAIEYCRLLIVDWKLVLFKAQAANLKLALLKAHAAKFRLTTPKAFTLTLGILGTLAHFRHFPLLATKDAAERRSWTFCEAVKCHSNDAAPASKSQINLPFAGLILWAGRGKLSFPSTAFVTRAFSFPETINTVRSAQFSTG